MSVETVEFNNIKVNFDEAKTQGHRTDYNTPCDCQDCRNFYANVKNNPSLIEFLSGFGVDYMRPEEVMSYDLGSGSDSLIRSMAYYCVFGDVSGNADAEMYGASISFRKQENVGHEIPEEYFYIVVRMDLPFVLEEERTLPPVGLFGKLLDLFKRKRKKRGSVTSERGNGDASR